MHSILQHCLIASADKSGLVALPEYKIALGAQSTGTQSTTGIGGGAPGTSGGSGCVAYFLDRKLVGVGEVYTPDEIHGCVLSREPGTTRG